MSYYTDFVTECDALTFERLVEYWKYADWEDYEFQCPQQVWRSKADPSHYLIYHYINHAPPLCDVDTFFTDTIGVDSKRYHIKEKGECDEMWCNSGSYPEFGGYYEIQYDEETGKNLPAPEPYKEYEYCGIAIDPSVWEDYEIDYTKEEVSFKPKDGDELKDELKRIADNLEVIADVLDRISEKLDYLENLEDGE